MSKLAELANAVEKGKSKLVPGLVQETLDEGNSPLDILNQRMIDAMGVVGEKCKAGELFVPEMLVAARAMNMTDQKPSGRGAFVASLYNPGSAWKCDNNCQ